jgi:hypothetical protein
MAALRARSPVASAARLAGVIDAARRAASPSISPTMPKTSVASSWVSGATRNRDWRPSPTAST